MSDSKQNDNLLVKNLFWPLLHPLGTVRACLMWLKLPVTPSQHTLLSGIILLLSVSFFGIMGAGFEVSSLSQAILSVVTAVVLWFLTLLFGLKGDLSENLHPWDLYLKSLMTGPFWVMIWAIIFHFIVSKGGL